MSELIARTKALLRRPGAALGATLRAGNIAFDTIGRDVSVAGIPLQLPRREAAILEHLLRRQGRVVPKSVLEGKFAAAASWPAMKARRKGPPTPQGLPRALANRVACKRQLRARCPGDNWA